jgi:hypothetical protein
MPLPEFPDSLTPDDLADRAKRQFDRLHLEWLFSPATESWPLRVGINWPTEAKAANAPAAFRAWLGAWSEFDGRVVRAGAGIALERKTLNWRKLGAISVPAQVTFSDAASVARQAGTAKRWQLLIERVDVLVRAYPGLGTDTGWAQAAATVAAWDQADFVRLLSLLAWAQANPDSGLYLRQLPLVDIDTKWVEPRTGAITPILQSVLRRTGDLHGTLGLRKAPDPIRMRLLDPALRAQLGHAEDLQMPARQWSAAFKEPPSRLLIVENLATGLAIPDMPNTAVAMRLGNNVSALQGVSWCGQAQVVYWGDIDTWGLHILSRARDCFPAVRSVLMTEEVLLAHRHLWTRETSQATGAANNLTVEEAQLLQKLKSDAFGERHVRLEQERLHWPSAMHAVLTAWDMPDVAE